MAEIKCTIFWKSSLESQHLSWKSRSEVHDIKITIWSSQYIMKISIRSSQNVKKITAKSFQLYELLVVFRKILNRFLWLLRAETVRGFFFWFFSNARTLVKDAVSRNNFTYYCCFHLLMFSTWHLFFTDHLLFVSTWFPGAMK